MKKFFLKNERIYIFLAWFIIVALIGSFIVITKLSEVLNVPALRIIGFAAVSIYLVILGLVYIFSVIKLYKNDKYEKRNAIILLLIGGGLHRFYNKQIFIAILYALTGGFFSIGFIYDLIKICKDDFKSNKFSDEEITEVPSKYDETVLFLLRFYLVNLGISLLIGLIFLFTTLSEIAGVSIGMIILYFIIGVLCITILVPIYAFAAIELYKNGKYEKRNAIILLLIGGGLHRIYNKQIAIAILYALTFGFFSIGFIYDLIKICTNDFKSTKFSDEEITEEPSKYSKTSISLFCLFLGVLGIHNFSCGRIAKGIIYLLTCGFFVIGVFIDLINIINNKYRDGQGKLIIK